MASKVDLYTEIGKLKDENEKLHRLAVKVPSLEENVASLTSDLSFYKEELDRLTKTLSEVNVQLKDELAAKNLLKGSSEEHRRAAAEATRKADRMQSDLKYDKLAREGQVKRSRILEHELNEVKHDNYLQTKLRKEAENRSQEQYINLQRERSLRLQDIHAKNKVLIAKATSERNEKLAEFERFREVAKASRLEDQLTGLSSTIATQQKVIKMNDDELADTLQEIETVRLENLRLHRVVQQREEEVLHHVEIRSDLERECHRLETALMVTSKTASDKSRPLLTASKGGGTPSLMYEKATAGKTRPETASDARIRRRTLALRNREFSETFTQGGGGGASGFGGGGSAITLDEAFIIPINARKLQSMEPRGTPFADASSASGRLGTANSVTFGESRGGMGQGSPGERRPSALRPTRLGNNNNKLIGFGEQENSENSGHGHHHQQQRHGDNALRMSYSAPGLEQLEAGDDNNNFGNSQTLPLEGDGKRKVKRPATTTTLNVPGSLFLGSGLGLRKVM